MESLKQIKISKLIDCLSSIVNITQEQKQKLMEKYSDLSDEKVLEDLFSNAYQLIGNNSPYYDYALDVIRNYNPALCPGLEEIKKTLDNKFSNNMEGNMSLEQNHELVISSLLNFCSLFNQYGIDYYIVGALPCFLKTNQPLFRYHDDIDIMIN